MSIPIDRSCPRIGTTHKNNQETIENIYIEVLKLGSLAHKAVPEKGGYTVLVCPNLPGYRNTYVAFKLYTGV